MVQIVKTPGTCSGDARLEGRRIKVRDILMYLQDWNLSKDELAQELDITLEQINAALNYYQNHQVEIEQEIRQAMEIAQRYESKHTSLLKKRLASARSATA